MMTFEELTDMTARNVGKGQWLERLAVHAANPNNSEEGLEESAVLHAQVAALRVRLRASLNTVYAQLARVYFPITHRETASLVEGWLLPEKLTRTPIRYRQVEHEGRPQVFLQREDRAEVFCSQPNARVAVTYSCVPPALSADADTPRLPAGVPHELLTFAAAADYYAQENMRQNAQFWDARYKDALSQLLKTMGVRMPSRRWR